MTNDNQSMRKAITLLFCCWALAFGASAGGTDILPLKAVNNSWRNKSIPVSSSNGTASVQAIIDAAGDNSYYQHDEATMPPGCHGIVFVDCEDFGWAYFHHMDGATQDVEARVYLCDNGCAYFVISFAEVGNDIPPFCCFYYYDPAKQMMTPEDTPFHNLPRKWANSTLHYYLGFEYDQTINVEETSPAGENWYHKYIFTGMAHIYDHSSAEAYEDMDEAEEEVRLPDDAEFKDEDEGRELYVNLDGVGSENGNGIKTSIDLIAAGNCFTTLFIPWDADKIFVEGCPDNRNVWSYIIDMNTREVIQLPTNEGLVALDPGKREIHMSHYLYDMEGGRYSVERVYTIDGRFTGKEYRIAD